MAIDLNDPLPLQILDPSTADEEKGVNLAWATENLALDSGMSLHDTLISLAFVAGELILKMLQNAERKETVFREVTIDAFADDIATLIKVGVRGRLAEDEAEEDDDDEAHPPH